jgi:hypothetical protein
MTQDSLIELFDRLAWIGHILARRESGPVPDRFEIGANAQAEPSERNTHASASSIARDADTRAN